MTAWVHEWTMMIDWMGRKNECSNGIAKCMSKVGPNWPFLGDASSWPKCFVSIATQGSGGAPPTPTILAPSRTFHWTPTSMSCKSNCVRQQSELSWARHFHARGLLKHTTRALLPWQWWCRVWELLEGESNFTPCGGILLLTPPPKMHFTGLFSVNKRHHGCDPRTS